MRMPEALSKARKRGRASALRALLCFCAVAIAGVAPPAHAADAPGERWALLIGVDKCKAIGELEVCCNDARALKETLSQVGYPEKHVLLLVDDQNEVDSLPTGGNIRRSVQYLAKVADEGDTILLFFSGHGISKEKDAYIVPVDGDRENAIALSWVTGVLATSKATSKVLILDACHAGAAKGVNGIAPDAAKATGLVMLLSCDTEQVSWPDTERGHSVFTAYLLEGLGGKAADKSRQVTHAALAAYVRKRVKEWTFAKKRPLQTPVVFPEQGDPRLVVASCPKTDVHPGGRRAKIYAKWPFDAKEAKRRQEETAKALGVPVEKTVDLGGGVNMEFVLVPAGEFQMGSPGSEDKRGSDEGPQHLVRITKPFYMGKTEVTQEQWERVTGESPSRFKGARNPVEKVSWNDSEAFLRKLNARVSEKGTFVLPTEAEWEYACRAGTGTPFHTGETISTDQANYDGDYTYGSGRKGVDREKTVRVGSFRPNTFGLYDMHGNVWEWCGDWYAEDYYKQSPKDDPQGPARGEYRVVRGGSWSPDPRYCRSAYRDRVYPSIRPYYCGCRLVLRDF